MDWLSIVSKENASFKRLNDTLMVSVCKIKNEYGLGVGYCRVYFTYRHEGRMPGSTWDEVCSWQYGHAMDDLNWMIRHSGYSYRRSIIRIRTSSSKSEKDNKLEKGDESSTAYGKTLAPISINEPV